MINDDLSKKNHHIFQEKYLILSYLNWPLDQKKKNSAAPPGIEPGLPIAGRMPQPLSYEATTGTAFEFLSFTKLSVLFHYEWTHMFEVTTRRDWRKLAGFRRAGQIENSLLLPQFTTLQFSFFEAQFFQQVGQTFIW